MSTKIRTLTIAGVVLAGMVLFTLMLGVPTDFPGKVRFEVMEGESLYSMSTRLEDERIIRSALLFRGWISLLKRDKRIGLGVYEFDAPLGLGRVVYKFVKGPDEPLLSVTIPEGSTTKQIADLVKKALPNFSVDRFGEIVYEKKLDGYLFPATYYPLPSYTEEDVIRAMKDTFEREYGKRFGNLRLPETLPTRNDVISLAAILEGEAKTPEDMKIIAGILQKRLTKGMRLQVDVAEVTYKTAGVPEQPISNPGTVAIDAVFHPIDTPYLYYLTGKDGKMYYAKTYEEHKRNIQKYLR